MVDHNQKLLQELLKKPGNNVCADCGSPGMFKCNLGVFECLCFPCGAWLFHGVANRWGA